MGASYSVKQIPDQTGKVIIITGGTAGLGLQSAVELLKKGAHVIITARSVKRGEDAIKQIQQKLGAQFPAGKIEFGIAEQEDLQSITAFANWFLAKNLPLHVLMLNAGVVFVPYRLIEGVESHLFINHVAAHHLTQLLLPKLKDSGHARVVVLSGDAYQFVSKLALEPPLPEGYKMMTACFMTKLANIHFTKALQRRVLKDNVFVNAVHPGAVATNSVSKWGVSPWLKALVKFITDMLLTSVERGVLTQLYVATSPDIETRNMRGCYFYPTAKVRARLPAYADDEAMEEQLWAWTEDKIKNVLDKPAQGS